jgi:hypothetical protein
VTENKRVSLSRSIGERPEGYENMDGLDWDKRRRRESKRVRQLPDRKFVRISHGSVRDAR